MNYADFGIGTLHPKGGMRSVVDAMISLAKELGVQFHNNSNVTAINIDSSDAVESIIVNGQKIPVDILISGADYRHTESLLPLKGRAYSEKYWSKKTMAPSSLLFFVGFSKKLKNVLHHTLFFDTSFDDHAVEIYDSSCLAEKTIILCQFPK